MRRLSEQSGILLLVVLYLGMAELTGLHQHAGTAGLFGAQTTLIAEPQTPAADAKVGSLASHCALCAAGSLHPMATPAIRTGPAGDRILGGRSSTIPVPSAAFLPFLQRRGPPLRLA